LSCQYVTVLQLLLSQTVAYHTAKSWLSLLQTTCRRRGVTEQTISKTEVKARTKLQARKMQDRVSILFFLHICLERIVDSFLSYNYYLTTCDVTNFVNQLTITNPNTLTLHKNTCLLVLLL